MASAPPQGFVAVSLDIEDRTEESTRVRVAKDTSLKEKNNLLLADLIRQLEIVTNEEDITGVGELSGRFR